MNLLFLFLHTIFYLVYRSFNESFSQGGGRCTLSPLLCLQDTLVFFVFSLCLWWLVVVGGCMRGIEVSGGVGCLCETWSAYLNSFSPVPSSHWGCCTLIWCAGTQDPCMQQWVARTKVISILLLTYPHGLY